MPAEPSRPKPTLVVKELKIHVTTISYRVERNKDPYRVRVLIEADDEYGLTKTYADDYAGTPPPGYNPAAYYPSWRDAYDAGLMCVAALVASYESGTWE